MLDQYITINNGTQTSHFKLDQYITMNNGHGISHFMLGQYIIMDNAHAISHYVRSVYHHDQWSRDITFNYRPVYIYIYIRAMVMRCHTL